MRIAEYIRNSPCRGADLETSADADRFSISISYHDGADIDLTRKQAALLSGELIAWLERGEIPTQDFVRDDK